MIPPAVVDNLPPAQPVAVPPAQQPPLELAPPAPEWEAMPPAQPFPLAGPPPAPVPPAGDIFGFYNFCSINMH